MNQARLFGVLLGTAMLAACQSMPPAGGVQARLESRSGSNVSGTVSFAQSGDAIVVTASISGLKPNAEHGFHIHEKGDCSAPDASSAGGHFNPAASAHGHRGAAHHEGDMPNIKADGAGDARYEARLEGAKVSDAQGIVGRSVVVHRDPDDYKTQPAGNSGPRIACGLIQR